MTADLAARVAAVVAERRAKAEAAAVWDGYWRVHPQRNGRVIEVKGNGWDDAIIASCVDYGGTENGKEQAALIAANDPADTIRRCNHADKVLARHGSWPMHQCVRGECFDRAYCPDVLDLAECWGVTP